MQAAEIVDIHNLPFPCLRLIELKYKSLLIQDFKATENEALALELLHDVTFSLTDPHPSWLGAMQLVHFGPNPGLHLWVFFL